MTENIHTPQKNNESSPLDTHFDDIIAMQSRDAARRLLLDSGAEQPQLKAAPQPELLEAKSAPELLEATSPSRMRKIGNKALATTAGVLAAAGALAGVATLGEHLSGASAEFSDEQTTLTISEGDSYWSAAMQVEGHESIDTRDLVRHIQDLNDGEPLTPGMQITIPVSVKK